MPSKIVMMAARRLGVCLLSVVVGLAVAGSALAQSALSGYRIRISRAAGRITIDGDLSDEGWRTATRELTDQRELAKLDRQFFVKISYAFQR